MNKLIVGIMTVMVVALVAGCGGSGNQSSIQGLLDMQCQKLVSEDVDGYVNLFEASITNPEWVEQGKPLIEMMFSMADIKGCTQKIVDIDEQADSASGTVEKYLKISSQIAEKYELPDYLKQRLMLLEKDIESIFEDETNKQFNLADFM